MSKWNVLVGFAVAVISFLLPMPILGQNAPRIETVLTLPQEVNGQTENITEGPDGSIYVTAAFDRILWKIKNGKAEFSWLGIESIVVMPVLRRGKLAGIIEVFSKQAYAFQERDVEALRGFTEMISAAIARANLSEGSDEG